MKMYFLLENLVDFAKLVYFRVVEMFPSSLDGGFKYVLISSRTLGEMIQCDSYFPNGLKPPTRIVQGGGFKYY